MSVRLQVSQTLEALELMGHLPDAKAAYPNLWAFCEPARKRWRQEAIKRQARNYKHPSWLQTCVHACTNMLARGGYFGDVVIEVCCISFWTALVTVGSGKDPSFSRLVRYFPQKWLILGVLCLARLQ
jgi:hypothetical protein